MLKRLVNQCTARLRLHAEEPMLINSGTSLAHDPDMSFVRTRRGGQLEPFIPGSSLKGVLRSHAERIARTLSEKSVCGVFGDAEVEGCGSRFESAGDPSDYERSCPACRLFGSTHWRGRFQTGDAYLAEGHRDVTMEPRDGVAIDRVTGGAASGAKFDLEVLPAGAVFETRLELLNFEAWQLGWVAYVLRDLTDGYLRLGMGTSRGLGRVTGMLDALTVEYVGEPDEIDGQVAGLGAFASKDEQERYGLSGSDRVALPEGFAFERPAGSLRSALRLTETSRQKDFLAAVAPAWDHFIKQADPADA